MAGDSATGEHPLLALAAHVAARSDAILRAWRKAVDRDPELTTGASLPQGRSTSTPARLPHSVSGQQVPAAGAGSGGLNPRAVW